MHQSASNAPDHLTRVAKLSKKVFLTPLSR
jgi:hypothetical protein